MSQRLKHEWTSDRPPTSSDDALAIEPRQVANKVKRSFDQFDQLAKGDDVHIVAALQYYSPGTDRLDVRLFLYSPIHLGWAFKTNDEESERVRY